MKRMKALIATGMAVMLCVASSLTVMASTGYKSQWQNFQQIAQGTSYSGYTKAVQRIVRDYNVECRDLIGDNGGIDGSFGTKTHNAVIVFQRSKGCNKVNGIVGPETWGKLDDVLSYYSTEYFTNDGSFDMYKGTGCYYTNFVIRRGTGSGNWSVRTSSAGTSEATNGTYQTFNYR